MTDKIISEIIAIWKGSYLASKHYLKEQANQMGLAWKWYQSIGLS